MTNAADLILTNAEVHTLADPDEVHEAVAVRDGRITRVDSTYEIEFLEGVGTETIDLGGRVLLPGFIDAHTHLPMTGRYLVHADLSGAADKAEALDRLHERADELDHSEWVLGFGYDESTWPEKEYPTREDLDAVSDGRPVAAFREDLHVASLNSIALERYLADMPDGDVHRDGDKPTGVVVEKAVDVIYRAVEPDVIQMTKLVRTAQEHANARGVTSIHDMVRQTPAPEVYRRLDLVDELSLRVRINYWSDHLDAILETGLRTNHGTGMVEVGAIKTYTDGSFGGRTAKLTEPYADGDTDGQWVVTPDDLRRLVTRADEAGLQLTAHAIGDEAIDLVLDAYDDCIDAGGARHRIEHAELTSDEAIERFSELNVVASVQPNFLKWAGEGGLYADRLGDRRTETNRYRDLLDADVPLAFGSDCMPLDPLLGVHHAVNPPVPEQRLSVTEALRAYTSGGAYAAFAEDRLGTVEPGKLADFVVLDDSPWDRDDDIENIDVAMTVVDGDVVYDGR